jgi:hypothetical protein
MRYNGDYYEDLARQEPDVHKRISLLCKAVDADEQEEAILDQQEIAMSNTPSSQRNTLSPGQQIMRDLRLANKREAVEKSQGHIGFFKDSEGRQHELYKTPGGELFRAPVSNVIDLDTKNRIGRWEAPAHMSDRVASRLMGQLTPPVQTANESTTNPPIKQPAPESTQRMVPKPQQTLDQPINDPEMIEGTVPGEVGTCPVCNGDPCVCPDPSTTPSSQRTSAALSPGRQVMKELQESKIMRERMARAQNPLPKY